MIDGLGGMIGVCCLGICPGYFFCTAIKIENQTPFMPIENMCVSFGHFKKASFVNKETNKMTTGKAQRKLFLAKQ